MFPVEFKSGFPVKCQRREALAEQVRYFKAFALGVQIRDGKAHASRL